MRAKALRLVCDSREQATPWRPSHGERYLLGARLEREWHQSEVGDNAAKCQGGYWVKIEEHEREAVEPQYSLPRSRAAVVSSGFSACSRCWLRYRPARSAAC